MQKCMGFFQKIFPCGAGSWLRHPTPQGNSGVFVCMGGPIQGPPSATNTKYLFSVSANCPGRRLWAQSAFNILLQEYSCKLRIALADFLFYELQRNFGFRRRQKFSRHILPSVRYSSFLLAFCYTLILFFAYQK